MQQNAATAAGSKLQIRNTRKHDGINSKDEEGEPATKTEKKNNNKLNQGNLIAVYNLIEVIVNKNHHDDLLTQSFALVNVFTKHKYTTVKEFLMKEK